MSTVDNKTKLTVLCFQKNEITESLSVAGLSFIIGLAVRQFLRIDL